MVTIKAKVKEIVGDFNMSADFLPALNTEVQSMVQKAIERARQTIEEPLWLKIYKILKILFFYK